eukprot:c13773_g1_i1 orf=418-1044(-)
MAMRTLLRQLRSKAPSLAQRTSGDCAEVVSPFWSPKSALGKRALMCNFYGSTVQTMNEDTYFLRRGYSSEAPLVDTDNRCIALDSQSHTTPEEENNPNKCTVDGLNSGNLGQKISERHNLAMIFTCTVCETRSAKTMSRQTYEKGVVIVRCGGCQNLHLIADRLGWFGEPGSVEDFLKHKGVEIRKGSEESYEFSVEDLAGWSPPIKE